MAMSCKPEHLAAEVRFGLDGGGTGSDFGARAADAASGDDSVSLEELRRALVRGGTRRELARKLGLSERTLYRRLAMAKGGGTHSVSGGACGALPFALTLPKWQYFCQSAVARFRQEVTKIGGWSQNRGG